MTHPTITPVPEWANSFYNAHPIPHDAEDLSET